MLKVAIGSRQIDLHVDRGAVVGDLPDILISVYGEKVEKCLYGDDEPFDLIRILINGRDHIILNDMATELRDGDVIALMPPLTGGS